MKERLEVYCMVFVQGNMDTLRLFTDVKQVHVVMPLMTG